jgi:hypothetical protein
LRLSRRRRRCQKDSMVANTMQRGRLTGLRSVTESQLYHLSHKIPRTGERAARKFACPLVVLRSFEEI